MPASVLPDRPPVVLVVEDDERLRRMYRDALTLIGGYAVIAVDDGVNALRYLDGSSAPAAVVLDLDLPRVSGQDVYAELSAHVPTMNVPIIVVTGNPHGIDASSVACVLTKPIDVEQLVASVASCLRRAKAQGTAT
jgi:two-component system cell cycle response regulator DivK